MIWKDMPAFRKGKESGSDIFISGTVHYRVFHLEKETGSLFSQ